MSKENPEIKEQTLYELKIKGKEFSPEDAQIAAQNISGFFGVLAEWESKEKL